MMSELVVGWLLLESAVIAEEAGKKVDPQHPDAGFYAGKVQSAIFFARNTLPGVAFKAELLAMEDKSATDIADAGFATV